MMDGLILALLGWLNLHTGYNTNVHLPNVVMTESANMCAHYGITDPGICKATKLMGFYDKKHTIYLHVSFDPNNEEDRSRLLHELIHYLQWQEGTHQGACWGDLEVEAYTLQDKWRWLNDVPGRADPFKLVMLEAACES